MTLLWSDLKEVVAFKQDMFTYDNLVFGFRIEEKDEYHFVDEEATGFYDLESALVQHLEGFDQDWMEKVALPAFAMNWHTVYGSPLKVAGD